MLYLNDGSGGLSRVTDSNNPITTDTDNSMAACWGDYDKDGYIDLFVANSGVDNALYRNIGGGGAFERVANSVMPADTDDTVDCAFGDIDGDGYLDLVLVSSDSTQANGIYYSNEVNNIRTFSSKANLLLPSGVSGKGSSRAVAIGNLGGPGDPDLDIVIVNQKPASDSATSTQRNYVYLNDGGNTVLLGLLHPREEVLSDFLARFDLGHLGSFLL